MQNISSFHATFVQLVQEKQKIYTLCFSLQILLKWRIYISNK